MRERERVQELERRESKSARELERDGVGEREDERE